MENAFISRSQTQISRWIVALKATPFGWWRYHKQTHTVCEPQSIC